MCPEKIIIVDYNKPDTVIKAEKKKTKLENQGWEVYDTKHVAFDKFRLKMRRVS